MLAAQCACKKVLTSKVFLHGQKIIFRGSEQMENTVMQGVVEEIQRQSESLAMREIVDDDSSLAHISI